MKTRFVLFALLACVVRAEAQAGNVLTKLWGEDELENGYDFKVSILASDEAQGNFGYETSLADHGNNRVAAQLMDKQPHGTGADSEMRLMLKNRQSFVETKFDFASLPNWLTSFGKTQARLDQIERFVEADLDKPRPCVGKKVFEGKNWRNKFFC